MKSVLVIDVGGTHVKVLATGQDTKRQFVSGPTLTPKRIVSKVKRLVADWKYDAVSIGYPGPVLQNRPTSDPWNLGKGWKGFDFEAAFKRPVKVINDAAMQALRPPICPLSKPAPVRAWKPMGEWMRRRLRTMPCQWRREIRKPRLGKLAQPEGKEVVCASG